MKSQESNQYLYDLQEKASKLPFTGGRLTYCSNIRFPDNNIFRFPDNNIYGFPAN